MSGWLNMFLRLTNTGLMCGLILGTLVLLRPVLKRVFAPQQRVVVWMVAWMLGWVPLSERRALLPVTFQTLVASRTGQNFSSAPAFLPVAYGGAGHYNLALPGDVIVRVSLTDSLLLVLSLVWAAGMAVMLLVLFLRGSRLKALVRQGRKLEPGDPLLARIGADIKIGGVERTTGVWISPGLPTSFVQDRFWENEICLQAELPQEQMELVLLHELEHVRLWHPWWKVIATVNLVLFWWNPLVWLGFRYFCRDMELACDASVMKKLSPDRQRKYARTLVDLGTGRQLWEAPLSFGECDAALRVKAVVGWKPRKPVMTIVTWAAAVLVLLFFYGGHRAPYPAQDLMLAWERETGGTTQFVETLNHEMAWKLGLISYGTKGNIPDLRIEEVWEAPDARRDDLTVAALWVKLEHGTWYHVLYGWWGEGTGTFGLLEVEEVPPPDVTGCDRLIG